VATVEQALQRAAEQVADRLKNKSASLNREFLSLEKQKLELEKKQAEIKATLDATSRAPQRLLNFVPVLGPDHHCPACWINHKTRSRMRSTLGTDDADFLRCNACDFEVEISFDR